VAVAEAGRLDAVAGSRRRPGVHCARRGAVELWRRDEWQRAVGPAGEGAVFGVAGRGPRQGGRGLRGRADVGGAGRGGGEAAGGKRPEGQDAGDAGGGARGAVPAVGQVPVLRPTVQGAELNRFAATRVRERSARRLSAPLADSRRGETHDVVSW